MRIEDIRQLTLNQRLDLSELMDKSRFVKLKITVIGAGGVGGNLFYYLAKWPMPVFFKVYDDDKIEYHNLNRSPILTLVNIGYQKTAVLPNIAYTIISRRIKRLPFHPDITINLKNALWCHPNCLNDMTKLMRVYQERVVASREWDDRLENNVIFDCRDVMSAEITNSNSWIKLSYDGGSNIAFTWWPSEVVKHTIDISSNRGGYQVTPSFYVPAAILSAMALHFFQYRNLANIARESAGNYEVNIDEVCQQVAYAVEDDEES